MKEVVFQSTRKKSASLALPLARRRTFHTGSEFSRIAAEEIQPVQAGQGSLGSS